MKRKAMFRSLLERVDIVGWLAVCIGLAWILLDVFNIEVPWLTDYLPQSLLLVLGILAVYVFHVLEQVKDELRESRSVETLIGNDRIYAASTSIVQQAPPHARFWATSFWFYPTAKEESPAQHHYFDVLNAKLDTDRESEYRRSCTAMDEGNWEILKTRLLGFLPKENASVRFYFENPLVLDCLIGETEAILGFPDRGSFPHLRVAFLIRDPQMVDSLRHWYREFVWDSPVDQVSVRGAADLEEIERRKGWAKQEHDSANPQ